MNNAIKPRTFRVGPVVKALRKARPESTSIERAAGSSGMSCTDRWQRLETSSDNLDRWLEDLDRAARFLGIPIGDLLARARIDLTPAGGHAAGERRAAR